MIFNYFNFQVKITRSESWNIISKKKMGHGYKMVEDPYEHEGNLLFSFNILNKILTIITQEHV